MRGGEGERSSLVPEVCDASWMGAKEQPFRFNRPVLASDPQHTRLADATSPAAAAAVSPPLTLSPSHPPDYLKCPHALAWTMANLALSMMEFRDAYIAAEQWDNSLALVKWGIDWLVKAHVSASDNPADNAFVGQVGAGHGVHTIAHKITNAYDAG